MTTVGVIGDALLDVYYDVVSSERDTAISTWAHRVLGGRMCLGGAANVAAGVRAAGAAPSLCSVVGPDSGGRALRTLLGAWGIDHANVREDPGYRTRVLTRLLGQADPFPVRFDLSGDLLPTLAFTAVAQSQTVLWNFADVRPALRSDAVVIADYGSMLTQPVVRSVIDTCQAAGTPVIADPGLDRLDWYRGCTVLKLNAAEAAQARNLAPGDASPEDNAHWLRQRVAADAVVVTLAEAGAVGVWKTGALSLPSRVAAQHVANPTGAGDAFAAGFAAQYAATRDIPQAIAVGLDVSAAAVRTACTCPITSESSSHHGSRSGG